MALVRIFDGKNSNSYLYWSTLRDMGFDAVEAPEACWFRDMPEEDVPAIEEWCFERGLEVETPYSRVSPDYRKRFWLAERSNLRWHRLRCVYCGRMVHQKRLIVDHLIDAKHVRKSKFYLWLLRKWECESVSDVRNLVPCCKFCHYFKDEDAGIWVIKGLLGRYRVFWAAIWILRLALLIGVFMFFKRV